MNEITDVHKPTCTLYGGRSHTKMCTSGFSFIPQGNEDNQLFENDMKLNYKN